MASLKDLLVMGPARFLNTLYGNGIQANSIYTKFGSLGSQFIPKQSDIDTYKTPGTYTAFYTDTVKSLLNIPEACKDEGLILYVQSLQRDETYSDRHVQQTLRGNKTGKTYTRRWHNDEAFWSPWEPQRWTEKRKFTISSEAGSTGTDVDGTADVELKIPEEMSNFKKITFADVGKNSSIVFSRESWNYISTASNTGSIALSPGGASDAHAVLVASNTAVFPGYRNNVALGTSAYPWSSIYGNTVHADQINVKYSLFVSNPEKESQTGVRFNSDSSALYLYGRHNANERGLYDSKAGTVIFIDTNNSIRFNGTASKADILATSRKLSINSTAGTTGTDFNGGGDVSLTIPSSVSGFTSVEGKLLQIKRDDRGPYLSLVYGDYSKGTCYLTGNSTSINARMGFYVYSKNSATKIPTDKYMDFRLPEVTPDLTSSQSHTILVADVSGNILLDKSLYLNIPSSVSRGIGIRYKNSDDTTSSTSTFYMFANTVANERGIYDSATGKRIINIDSDSVITLNGNKVNASNNMYVNGQKVYHEGTIVYSVDEPTPATGMIWLKPLAQTQG